MNAVEKDLEREKDKGRKELSRSSRNVIEKELEMDKDKRRKANDRLTASELFDRERNAIKDISPCDPAILRTDFYKRIKSNFESRCKQYPCHTCKICWKNEFKSNTCLMHPENYSSELYKQLLTNVSTERICNSCHKQMLKGNIPSAAIKNNLSFPEKVPELEDLCALEHLLICQIVAFMFLVGRHSGAQSALKGQVVLVPADLGKICKVLPRSCVDGNFLTLQLKRRLSDRLAYKKQTINPAAVNAALMKLKEINPFYADVELSDDWQRVSEETDPTLWALLTESDKDIAKDISALDIIQDSDSDDNADDPSCVHQEGVPSATVMHNTDGPDIRDDEIVNIAPGEGQIPVFASEVPHCEALAFPRHFPTGKFHFAEKRKEPIKLLQYIHRNLKSCDARFASDPQYVFFALDWLERTSVHNAIMFSERKTKGVSCSVAALQDRQRLHKMLSNDEIMATFKTIRGSPQYWHNMQLDILAKIRYYGRPTFFMTWSANQFGWNDIIKAVGAHFGITLSDEQIGLMKKTEKENWLKRNPVTVARQIDHIFRSLWGEVVVGGLYPIGEILNFDERSEFQSGTGVQHLHNIIHVKGAPLIDEQSDNEVITFIDNFITCSIPEKNKFPKLYELATTVQSHNHSFTCRKTRQKSCRFNFPLPPTEQTIISRAPTDSNNLKKNEDVVEKVLASLQSVQDLSVLTCAEIVCEAGLTMEQYKNALGFFEKKCTILYKRKPNEVNISPYNTVILSLLRANMNIQFCTSIYAVIAYLTSYLCKPERSMSELMRKTAKECDSENNRSVLRKVGGVLIRKRETSLHETCMRALSMDLRKSNNEVVFVPTGDPNKRCRVLKPQSVLDKMMKDNPEDTNIFASNIFDKYAARPDHLDHLCLADFVSNYKYCGTIKDHDPEQQFFQPVKDYEVLIEQGKLINLKNDLGKMRLRSKPCVLRWYHVSQDKSSEGYCMRVLQLYLPWRNEGQLLHSDGLYFSKLQEVFPNIQSKIEEYEKCEDISEEDLQGAYIDDSDEGEDENVGDDLDILNPCNLDLNVHQNAVSSLPYSTEPAELFLPRHKFHDGVAVLNPEQRTLFQFTMWHAQSFIHNEKNGLPLPDPYFIYLSGCGGTGKSHIVNLISDYLRRTLKPEDLDHCSLLVAASTGTAASKINGTTLHSAFKLPISDGNYRKTLSDKTLKDLRIKYQNLRVLISDEISMTSYEDFFHLFCTLCKVLDPHSPFGGISVICCGDFFQLPPVHGTPVFIKPNKSFFSILPHIWREHFKLHELTHIVRQSGDPKFAEILSRVRTGDQTDEDVNFIDNLKNTDLGNLSTSHTTLYITNRLAGLENDRCLANLPGNKITILAKDSKHDLFTNSSAHSIPHDAPLHKTGGLPFSLTICAGARCFMTTNEDLDDHLVNGATGTIRGFNIYHPHALQGTVYVEFDNPKAGAKLRRSATIQNNWVPVKATTNSFCYKSKGLICKVTRRQFPLVIAHGMTIHKSQGAQYSCLSIDLDKSTVNPKRKCQMQMGQLYTALSRAENSAKLKVTSFESKDIKVNTAALDEMQRMRTESRFSFEHPVDLLKGCKIVLHNIVSWSAHISHFLSDPHHLMCDILCFTETKLPNDTLPPISQGWENIFLPSPHGLAICYNSSSVTLKKRLLPISNAIECLICHFLYDAIEFICILVYRKPGPIRNFLHLISDELNNLPVDVRVLLIGDFNLDQLLPNNVQHIESFNNNRRQFFQRSIFTTHILGGILDLVLDTDSSSLPAKWLPSPFSDHYVIYFNV